ncbi:MAG: hypothetical protein JWM51_733 [Microbacteriaceae bacterium]|nr:hypothetical protein [Microbacteriaceae bacterium]
MSDNDREADELQDAHHASSNSAMITVLTIAFGVIWLAERDSMPSWLISVWFVFVIPLSLFLMFMYRRRYRALLELHGVDHRDSEGMHH